MDNANTTIFGAMEGATAMESSLTLISSPDMLPASLRAYAVKLGEGSNPFGGDVWFHHPLYVAPFPLALPGDIETLLRLRREVVDEALREGNLARYVFRHERAYRIPALLSYVHDEMSPGSLSDEEARAIWVLAGQVWTDAEIDERDPLWGAVLGLPIPHRQYMGGAEGVEALAALPATVRVYRGVQGQTVEEARAAVGQGHSWTTQVDTAAFFARRYLPAGFRAFVACAEAPKATVIAHLVHRGESEIILPLSQKYMGIAEIAPTSPRSPLRFMGGVPWEV